LYNLLQPQLQYPTSYTPKTKAGFSLEILIVTYNEMSNHKLEGNLSHLQENSKI
jgi:hypothetical protein